MVNGDNRGRGLWEGLKYKGAFGCGPRKIVLFFNKLQFKASFKFEFKSKFKLAVI